MGTRYVVVKHPLDKDGSSIIDVTHFDVFCDHCNEDIPFTGGLTSEENGAFDISCYDESSIDPINVQVTDKHLILTYEFHLKNMG